MTICWKLTQQIWTNVAFTCSPMDLLQWMGDIIMRVQTADKTINQCLVKRKALFVRNKSSIKTFIISNLFFLSIISLSPDKYAQVKHKQISFTNMLVGFYVRGQQGMDFLTGGSAIMDYGLLLWPEATIWIFKNALMMDLFLTNTTFLCC